MWPFCSPSLRQAAFVVRRLAWAEGTSCTRYLRGLLQAAARAAAGGRVCAACRQHHGDRDLLGRAAGRRRLGAGLPPLRPWLGRLASPGPSLCATDGRPRPPRGAPLQAGALPAWSLPGGHARRYARCQAA